MLKIFNQICPVNGGKGSVVLNDEQFIARNKLIKEFMTNH